MITFTNDDLDLIKYALERFQRTGRKSLRSMHYDAHQIAGLIKRIERAQLLRNYEKAG